MGKGGRGEGGGGSDEYEWKKLESDLGKGRKSFQFQTSQVRDEWENRSSRGKNPLVGRKQSGIDNNRKEILEKFVRVPPASKIARARARARACVCVCNYVSVI